MLSPMEPVRANLAYLFLIAGVIWFGMVYVTSSLLILWPAVACLVGGLLLKLRAESKLSNPWAVSAALLGFLLSGYQAYMAVPFMVGAFALVAVPSLVLFVVFAILHLFLLYGSGVQPKSEEELEREKREEESEE